MENLIGPPRLTNPLPSAPEGWGVGLSVPKEGEKVMSEEEYDGPDGPQWEGTEETQLLLLLERVARLCAEDVNDINANRGHVLKTATSWDHVMPTDEMTQVIASHMEARLGPLLRAGCAMRTNIGRWGVAVESVVKSAELFTLSERMEIVQPAVDRCDAALSAWNVARMDAIRALGDGDKK